MDSCLKMGHLWFQNIDQGEGVCLIGKALPDFLVERADVVGEGALADQLAKLADLYIAKQQGNRMAGLADLGEDLLKLA